MAIEPHALAVVGIEVGHRHTANYLWLLENRGPITQCLIGDQHLICYFSQKNFYFVVPHDFDNTQGSETTMQLSPFL